MDMSPEDWKTVAVMIFVLGTVLVGVWLGSCAVFVLLGNH